MTIEDKLKSYILTRYKSILEFSKEANIPYTTVKSILERGIDGAKISSIIKICNTLRISADALGNGEIKLREDIYTKPITEIKIILEETKNKLQHTNHLTIDGKEVDQDSIDSMIEALDIGYEMTKRKNER
jgi:predicted transcriptional regulator